MKRTSRYVYVEDDPEVRAEISLRRTVSIAATELRYKLALEGKSPTEAEIHAAETEAAERWRQQRNSQ